MMSHPNEKVFEDICIRDASPGYVLNNFLLVDNETITMAACRVEKHIKECMQRICEGWQRGIKQFYIGKSHINKRSRGKFDPANPPPLGD